MTTRDKPHLFATPKNSMPVHNAGCVLTHSYFAMLFERLELMANQRFVNEDAQQRAVHYLQYVVTGLSNTEEHDLPLNKVLCGVPVAQHIVDSILVPEKHAKLINGMINAIIGHWPANGASSVDGFRGNWLVREGLLIELDDKWELVVEKRAYDLLIARSPFSFSVIKHPWMDKPLHVTWPW
jgi:hypothetical protein